MAEYYKTLNTLENKEYKLPRIIYNHLLEFKNRVKNKFDAPFIITGSVGSGKSNLAIGMGGTWQEVLWGKPFTLDNIHFNSDKVVEKTNQEDNFGEFIDYDETIQGGSGRDSLTKIGQLFRKAMISKRFKGHCIAFCVDSLKELNDKIIERSLVWYHVHHIRMPSGNFRKGIVKVFSAKQALKVYRDLKDKKYIFTNEHPIWQRNRMMYNTHDYSGLWFSEEEYNSKKSRETDLMDEKDNTHINQRNRLIKFAVEKGIKQIEIARCLKLTKQTIHDIAKSK